LNVFDPRVPGLSFMAGTRGYSGTRHTWVETVPVSSSWERLHAWSERECRGESCRGPPSSQGCRDGQHWEHGPGSRRSVPQRAPGFRAGPGDTGPACAGHRQARGPADGSARGCGAENEARGGRAGDAISSCWWPERDRSGNRDERGPAVEQRWSATFHRALPGAGEPVLVGGFAERMDPAWPTTTFPSAVNLQGMVPQVMLHAKERSRTCFERCGNPTISRTGRLRLFQARKRDPARGRPLVQSSRHPDCPKHIRRSTAPDNETQVPDNRQWRQFLSSRTAEYGGQWMDCTEAAGTPELASQV